MQSSAEPCSALPLTIDSNPRLGTDERDTINDLRFPPPHLLKGVFWASFFSFGVLFGAPFGTLFGMLFGALFGVLFGALSGAHVLARFGRAFLVVHFGAGSRAGGGGRRAVSRMGVH